MQSIAKNFQSVNDDSFGEGSLSDFQKISKIGSGTYGVVYKAFNKKSSQIIALKKMILEIENEGVPSFAMREIALLREIQHKNIVSLFDIVIENKKLFLVFEYLDKDVKQHIDSLKENEFLDSKTIKKFLYQLLEGTAACHARRILHRDLKPQNLLLDKKGTLKIADFGLSRIYTMPIRPYTSDVVTLWYRAPELLLGSSEYSTPIDIWSIGCIFSELVTKRALFQGDSEVDQLYRIFRVLGTPNEQIWPGVTSFKGYKMSFPNWRSKPLDKSIANLNLDILGMDLLQRMLYFDPCKRISAKEALKHPYFKDIKPKNTQNNNFLHMIDKQQFKRKIF